ncbi:MAG: bifunctional metallophosphatase/5'-nucleotidase [Erysipelotrichaceae bacterium]|nr:bifunctional metallophosphatase/5'-nucleotidase [Erysipelotrichaceae bacterium]
MIKINLLSHADYSGQIRRDGNACGLDYFKKAIDRIRNEDPDHSLLLDAGDNSSHLLWGDFITEAVKLLGTDVFELGNHEFDRGEEDLETRIARLNPQVRTVCSNIVKISDGSTVKGAEPYVLLEKAGITYGIFGLCTEYTPYMVTKPMIEPFKVLDSIECARKYIPDMRSKGAEIVIVLTHFPFYADRTGELFDVFQEIRDLHPDAMIGGHIPGDFAEVIDGCAISKAGFGGKSLGHTTLYFDEETRQVVDREVEVIDVMNTEKEYDPETAKILETVLEPYRYYYEETAAEIVNDIPMRLDFESPMGDLLADAVRQETKADFAYFNCTSCGRFLPKGKITRAIIASAMGFNDYLYQGIYTGKDLYDLFEHIHIPERFGNNGNIFFSGMMVKMNHHQPAGRKVVYIREENGEDVLPEDVFHVVTSEYMMSGGNDTGEISSRTKWSSMGIRVHDVLWNYFCRYDRIDASMDDRYLFLGKPENDNSPW